MVYLYVNRFLYRSFPSGLLDDTYALNNTIGIYSNRSPDGVINSSLSKGRVGSRTRSCTSVFRSGSLTFRYRQFSVVRIADPARG